VIKLTRLNGSEIVLNADLIEVLESTPDTVVSLTTGKKFVVKEEPDEVIRRVIDYRRAIRGPLALAGGAPAGGATPR